MTRRSLPAIALLLAVLAPRAAADPAGKIVYLEGAVAIVRDEDTLAAGSVKEGLLLENFDLLKTGADGQLEVLITTPTAPWSWRRPRPTPGKRRPICALPSVARTLLPSRRAPTTRACSGSTSP